MIPGSSPGTTARTREVTDLINQIRPLLAGHAPEVQGATLADLLAIWLAHHVAADADATRTLRAELLADHCSAVRLLVPINAAILGTDPL